MTLKAIDSFVATVDPKRSTVVSFSNYIAVFGGALSPLRSRSKKPRSFRDAFVRWVREKRADLANLLLVPENFEDWNDFDVYSDLLLFEKDLGYLTSAVLVFLEAPGAIAELGAFSQIDSLSERLLIVVTDVRHPAKSFISLGPIRSVFNTQKRSHSLCVIPDASPSDFINSMPIVVDTLDKKRSSNKAGMGFDAGNERHKIMLILDLINLFQVVQITELQQLARHFDVELDLTRLEQMLFVLKKTGLVVHKWYGDNQYYLPGELKEQYMDYTSKPDVTSFERTRAKSEVFGEIQKDQFRKNVYESALRSK